MAPRPPCTGRRPILRSGLGHISYPHLHLPNVRVGSLCSTVYSSAAKQRTVRGRGPAGRDQRPFDRWAVGISQASGGRLSSGELIIRGQYPDRCHGDRHGRMARADGSSIADALFEVSNRVAASALLALPISTTACGITVFLIIKQVRAKVIAMRRMGRLRDQGLSRELTRRIQEGEESSIELLFSAYDEMPKRLSRGESSFTLGTRPMESY